METRHVAAIRAFNRFYTRRIGLLGEGHLQSPFSLTEARVLYELAHRRNPVASDLVRDLGLDPGYLSRILLKFHKLGLVAKKRSPDDGRLSYLLLTAKGRKAFSPLNRGANREVAKLVSGLDAHAQAELLSAMRTIERLLGAPQEDSDNPPYLLRPLQSGDLGWVVHRHGVLYSREHGYDERFEALVAEIAGSFVRNFDARAERCWIAERNDQVVGSVFLVKQTDSVAKLRLLLVEPSARGLGIGKRLVEECIRFARQAGYRTITLWTQQELVAAQHVYRGAGFCLVREQPHAEFGVPMVGQIWEMAL